MKQQTVGRIYHKMQIEGGLQNCTVGKAFQVYHHICRKIALPPDFQTGIWDISFPPLMELQSGKLEGIQFYKILQFSLFLQKPHPHLHCIGRRFGDIRASFHANGVVGAS